MLKTTESFVPSAFKVDDDEFVGSGGSAGAGGSVVEAESGGSVVKQKVDSIIRNYP